nr:DGQHR domain-containing protein [uncultured Trichococcus sp.]
MSTIDLSSALHINQGQTDNYSFYINYMKASDIYKYSNIIRLSESKDGVQRFLDPIRVKNIAKYCENDNAIFPTPIILSLNSDFIKDGQGVGLTKLIIDISKDMIEELGNPFSIIDGQHRIEGIKSYHEFNNINNSKDFILPVIIYEDADQATAASIFVTINANQRPVDKSLIHQLFGIMYDGSDKYTVQSFSNVVTKILNENENSPFFHSIRMLGRKLEPTEFISQGTIAKKITDRITSNIEEDNLNIQTNKDIKENSNKIFRIYFSKNEPAIVAKIMINFFNAFSKVFKDIWEDEGYLTKKAVGFSALMKLLDYIYKNSDKLKEEQLIVSFTIMQKYLDKKDKEDKEVKNEGIIQKLFKSSGQGSSESKATEIGKKLVSYYEEGIKNSKSEL